MRKGLKLFGQFTKLYLEVCVPDEYKKRFEHEYTLRTGGNPKNIDGYNDRHRTKKYSAWGIEFRAYYDGPDWLETSLRKLGFHTEISNKLIAIEFNTEHPDNGFTHRISNQELFWWLVDYGYKLGENNAIPYEFYLVRQALIGMKNKRTEIIPTVGFNLIEAENPVYEAQLLAVA